MQRMELKPGDRVQIGSMFVVSWVEGDTCCVYFTNEVWESLDECRDLAQKERETREPCTTQGAT